MSNTKKTTKASTNATATKKTSKKTKSVELVESDSDNEPEVKTKKTKKTKKADESEEDVEKTKKRKKAKNVEPETQEEQFDHRKLPMFSNEVLESIYKTEYEAYKKSIDDLDKQLENQTGKGLSDKDKENLLNVKNTSVEKIEKNFKESIEYIKSNIYFGYDGYYYVKVSSGNGDFSIKEYDKKSFNDTFGAFIKENNPFVHKWYKSYSVKYVLTMSLAQPRTFQDKHRINHFNLFAGYKYDKRDERDEARIERGKEGLEFMLNHLKEVLNSGNEQNYEYDRNWIIKLINGNKMKTMLYYKSKQGTGKSSFVTLIKNALGVKNFLPVTDEKHITGEFNGSLMGKALVYLDEVVHDYDSAKSLLNRLKVFITEDMVSYRNLFKSLQESLNVSSFIMTGNFDGIKLDDFSTGKDRRVKIADVLEELKDQGYYDLLKKYSTSEDVAYALFWYCIDNYDPEFDELSELKKLPLTKTKENMIRQSLGTIITFLKHFVHNEDCDKHIKPKDFYKIYKEYMTTELGGRALLNKNSFIEKLNEHKKYIVQCSAKIDGGNTTNYIKIDVEKMIKHFINEKFYDVDYDDIPPKYEHLFEMPDKPTVEVKQSEIYNIELTNNDRRDNKLKKLTRETIKQSNMIIALKALLNKHNISFEEIDEEFDNSTKKSSTKKINEEESDSESDDEDRTNVESESESEDEKPSKKTKKSTKDNLNLNKLNSMLR